MSLPDNNLYEFGEFRLNTREKLLVCGENKISLSPKVFEMLVFFLENSGKLVTKNELMEKLWADSFVEESNLTFTIRQLRKILNDDSRNPIFIETIPRSGYRFIANVRKIDEITTFERIEDDLPKIEISNSSSTNFMDKPTYSRKYTAIALGLFIFLSILLSGFIYRATLGTNAATFNKVELKRVTTNGNAIISAISPDGKYVVHVKEENGAQGLYVRQIEETKDIEVIPPKTIQFWGLTVSPNNGFIFYTVWEANKPDASLFQVPILGGTPKKVLDIIDSSVSFSPDGSKITYTRTFNSANISELVTANADGTEINVLATRKAPETFDVFQGSPAWSPDGKMIVAVGASTNLGEKCQLISFDVKSGQPTPLTEKKWATIEQISWLPKQNGLVFNAGEISQEWKQIWIVTYPDGDIRKITNDLSDYVGIKPSADGKTLVTVQKEQLTRYSVASSSEITNGKNILTESGRTAVNEGIVWSPDGKIILRYSQNNQDGIWQIDADGENKKQLTQTDDIQPTISDDGETIVFSSGSNGINRLWRMDRDGGNRKLLTNEEQESETFPSCSPVSKICVYQRGWKRAEIYRTSLENGEITPLITKGQAIRPTISPDGKLFAYFGLDGLDDWFLAIAKLDNGEIIKKFPIGETVVARYARWSPDSKNLAYIDTRDKVSNIMLQPVTGEKPQQITDFKADEIFYFDWSRNGKQFAITRGTSINNVVAINNAE